MFPFSWSRGLTNKFLVATGHPVAIAHNDSSVLERFHVAEAFMIALRMGVRSPFAVMSAETHHEFRSLVIAMVLSTVCSSLVGAWRVVYGTWHMACSVCGRWYYMPTCVYRHVSTSTPDIRCSCVGVRTCLFFFLFLFLSLSSPSLFFLSYVVRMCRRTWTFLRRSAPPREPWSNLAQTCLPLLVPYPCRMRFAPPSS